MVENSEKHIGQIERFVLKSVLGTGQFGTGYAAKDNQASVCVKVFHDDSENETITTTFKIELEQAFVNLSHPNVLQMFGAGRADFILN